MRPIIFLFMLFAAVQGMAQTDQKAMPRLIYVYDPLCGWCFGFGPTMARVWETYKDSATLEVIPGGMVRGSAVGPLSDIAPYIRQAYTSVEELTGAKFGKPYLDELFGEARTIQDSEPACLAQTAMSILHPERSLAFAKAVQQAIYVDGIAPTDRAALSAIAVNLGADKSAFDQLMADDDTYQRMINHFNQSEGMGVTGYPTLFLEIEDQRYVVCRGYASYEDISKRIAQIRAK
jgi:putative protein-disulfide isomerase